MEYQNRTEWMRRNKGLQIYMGRGFSGKVETHTHPYYQCTLVLTGAISQQQEGRTFLHLPGMLFFTPPFASHSLFIYDVNTTYYCLSYEKKLVTQQFKKGWDHTTTLLEPYSLIKPDIIMQKILIALMEHIYNKQKTTTEIELRSLHALAGAFLTIAVESTLEESTEEDVKKQGAGGDVVKNCIRYIDKNYATIKNLQELASFSGLSVAMLYRLFPKETQMTVHEYITHKRIHEAAKMIHLQNDTLAEVGRKVGYPEFSTFYRNFIKITKMSPSAYQSLIRMED